MIRRRLWLAGLLCLSLLAVAACGTNSESHDSSLEAPAPPITPNRGQSPDDESREGAQDPELQGPDEADGGFSILPAPEDGDGEVSIMPFPVDEEIERDNLVIPFQPIDDDRHNWDLTGDDPLEVATLFALEGRDDCDCIEMNAVVYEETAEATTVEVSLGRLRDDSVRDLRYRVTLVQENGTWTIAAAEREMTCHRGVSPRGLCT